MFEWYFPWERIDWILKVELLIWLAVIIYSYWVAWRTLVKKKPWLRKKSSKRS